MNKTIPFLIILVLAARGLLFLSDHNMLQGSSATEVKNTTEEPVGIDLNEPKMDTAIARLKTTAPGTVTFLLADNHEIYYYKGAFNGILKRTDYFQVRELIKRYKSQVDPDELMFIIKSEPGTTFKNTIDILDEMSINEIPPGHYAEVDITKEETQRLNILKKTKNG